MRIIRKKMILNDIFIFHLSTDVSFNGIPCRDWLPTRGGTFWRAEDFRRRSRELRCKEFCEPLQYVSRLWSIRRTMVTQKDSNRGLEPVEAWYLLWYQDDAADWWFVRCNAESWSVRAFTWSVLTLKDFLSLLRSGYTLLFLPLFSNLWCTAQYFFGVLDAEASASSKAEVFSLQDQGNVSEFVLQEMFIFLSLLVAILLV